MTDHFAPHAYFWTSLNQLRMREGKFSSFSANSAVLHKSPKFWPMMNRPMNNKWNKIKIQIYSVITAQKRAIHDGWMQVLLNLKGTKFKIISMKYSFGWVNFRGECNQIESCLMLIFILIDFTIHYEILSSSEHS